MNASWIMPTISLALLALGVALLAWSLFWDRARGRKRCPKCWYDMAGAPGLVCPECGRDARCEQRLRKSRRRWGWAVVGILISLGGLSIDAAPRVRNEGVWGIVPTIGIVLLAPLPEHSDDYRRIRASDSGVWSALNRRLQYSDMSPLSSRILLGRCANRYPEDVRSMIRTRSHWPEGESIFVEIVAPSWLLMEGPADLILRPHEAGMNESRDHLWVDAMTRMRAKSGAVWRINHDLGAPRQSENSIQIDVEKRLWTYNINPDGTFGHPFILDQGTGWKTSIDLPVLVGGDIHDIMTAVRSEQIAKAIREIGSGVITIDPRDRTVKREVIGDLLTLNRTLDVEEHPTIALSIELVRDGEVVAQGRVGYIAKTGVHTRRIYYSDGSSDVAGVLSQRLTPATDALFEPAIKSSKWVMRFRGDPRLALRNFDQDEYWDGEVEVPVKMIKREAVLSSKERADPVAAQAVDREYTEWMWFGDAVESDVEPDSR